MGVGRNGVENADARAQIRAQIVERDDAGTLLGEGRQAGGIAGGYDDFVATGEEAAGDSLPGEAAA